MKYCGNLKLKQFEKYWTRRARDFGKIYFVVVDLNKYFWKSYEYVFINSKGTEYSSSDVGIEDLEDDPRDVRIASLVASQTGTTARVQQQIGWLCGEPMPDYAHVVYKSVR